MIRALVVTYALLAAAHAHSIGVSDNATAPQTSSSEFFPDWVPFKNKHGEDLGEFVQVENKSKPKKRLAPPVNFIMRAVAEPEGDDYYDKGQGESDNEDDFEKKEWSDLNRGAQPLDGAAPLNHTDISDIDGVVSIITREPSSPVLDALRPKESHARVTSPENQPEEAKSTPEETSTEAPKQQVTKKEEEEDSDYEETSAEKPKSQLSEEERRENEAKKAKILDSVDELKVRHAEEQKFINERLKEEEMFKEERERDRLEPREQIDKYGGMKTSKKVVPDYEEYDEDTSVSVEDKYEVKPQRRVNTPAPAATTTWRKGGDKHSPPGKQSVFKNPRLYVSYDDESDEGTSTEPPAPPSSPARRGSRKYSAKFRAKDTTPATDAVEGDRISLVPDDADAKEGEPTLFFPKKTKNKRRRIKTTPTPATDSFVAETVTEKTARLANVTDSSTAVSAELATSAESAVTAVSAMSAPSAGDVADGVADAESAAASLDAGTSAVTDALPASTDHKDDKKKHENYENEKGGGREYHSQHEEERGERGNKAYEGYHEDSKTAKGHTDKETHSDRYDDQGGVEKEHHDESGHYGTHRHEEHGKKHAEYEESGKHSKGHSTKGSHDIHKKEEYEKKVEFFEEEGDSAEDEKHGGFQEEHEHEKGGHFKVGGVEATHKHYSKGESGHFDKSGHVHAHKGHQQAGGHDAHEKRGHRGALQAAHAAGKKWVYHHGQPARSANLVLIDRRADKYTHGPQYFG